MIQTKRSAAPCPVAALATEADSLAAVWWAIFSSTQAGGDSGGTPIAKFAGDKVLREFEGVGSHFVARAAVCRLNEIASVASVERATSVKGAAFQALLMAVNCLRWLDQPGVDVSIAKGLELSDEMDRAAESIISVLSSAGGALGPDLLRFYGFSLRPSTDFTDAADRFERLVG